LPNLTIDGPSIRLHPNPGVRQNQAGRYFPADIVESVEINKTFGKPTWTPDGIGGLREFWVTKTCRRSVPLSMFSVSGVDTPPIITTVRWPSSKTRRHLSGSAFGRQQAAFGALIGGTYDWNGRGN